MFHQVIAIEPGHFKVSEQQFDWLDALGISSSVLVDCLEDCFF